jgi:hypothetical protein
MSCERASASNFKERDCVEVQMEKLAVRAVEKDWERETCIREDLCVHTAAGEVIVRATLFLASLDLAFAETLWDAGGPGIRGSDSMC